MGNEKAFLRRPSFQCGYLSTPLGIRISLRPRFRSIIARSSSADLDRFREEEVFGVEGGSDGGLRHVFKAGSRLLMGGD